MTCHMGVANDQVTPDTGQHMAWTGLGELDQVTCHMGVISDQVTHTL